MGNSEALIAPFVFFCLCWTTNVLFSPLLISVSVCFVSSIAIKKNNKKKQQKTSKRIFGKLSGLFGHNTRNNLQHFEDVTWNPLHTFFSFHFFRENSCRLATLRKKRLNGLSWHFQDRSDNTQNSLKHFADNASNHFDTGIRFLFSGSRFVSNIRKNDWMEFRDFF